MAYNILKKISLSIFIVFIDIFPIKNNPKIKVVNSRYDLKVK